MKTGYLDKPGRNNFLANKKFLSFFYLSIGWILAANFFIIIKTWGIEDTTGYLILSEQKSLLGVHVEATIMGLALGLILAWIDQFRVHMFGRKKGFGVVILIKAFSYLSSIILIVTIVAFIFLLFLGANLGEAAFRIGSFVTSTYFLTIVIYGAAVSFLFSFIKQVDSKFGPGNLINLLTGKYHSPKIEDRIFLFIDLKNATGSAEKLGHIKYSQLIQDCFYDITPLMKKYRAEIYQYVGDEIVITWKSLAGIKNLNCVRLYFSFMKRISQRSDYYMKKYRLIPEFKAGMNCGHITVAEVGIIKREIAYHGDTINTASRIQDQCNKYGKCMLVSGQLQKRLGEISDFKVTFMDMIALKGKKKPVELYCIDE